MSCRAGATSGLRPVVVEWSQRYGVEGVLPICPRLVWSRKYCLPVGAYGLGLRYHFLPARALSAPALTYPPCDRFNLYSYKVLVRPVDLVWSRLFGSRQITLSRAAGHPSLLSHPPYLLHGRSPLHDTGNLTDDRSRASQTSPSRHLHAPRIQIAGPCATPVSRSFC